MQNRVKRDYLVLLILLAAFGLRVFRLGYQPLWSDEVYSVAVARHSVSEVAAWIYRDNHPALYWFVLYPVVHLLGDGELLVRFPSAFMGTLSVALTYTAGRQIFGSRRTGTLAALWLTMSPIHVVFSQEARMYAPLTLFGIASTLFLHRGASRVRIADWILFGLTAAATAHSHNYGLLLVAAQALCAFILLLWRRDNRLAWGSALSLAIFAVCYGPMILALMTQLQMSVGSTGIATPHDVVDLLEAFGAGFAGFSTPGLTPGRLIRRTAAPSIALTWALALLGVLAAGRRNSSDKAWAEFPGQWKALLLAICLTFPVVFVYGYSSLMQKAVWQVRGFQVTLGCFALLVGAGLSCLGSQLLRWAICVTLIVIGAVNLYPHYFDRYKSTVPDAVAALEGRLGCQDILFVAPVWNWTPFRYYYRDEADAIGGWQQGGTLHPVAVGTDYADLVEPRSLLDIQSKVNQPILHLSRFSPDDYNRVWAVGHGATPQQILRLFGHHITIMHYDAETRQWRGLAYPAATSLPDLLSNARVSSLGWDNGLRLLGYKWQRAPVVGQTTHLTLFWTSEDPQAHPSYLKVQLKDSNGEAVLERQETMLSVMHGLPMTSLGIRSKFPTTAWPVGGIVVQDVEFNIPSELPPRPYRLDLQVVDKTSGEVVPTGGEHGVLDIVSVTRSQEPLEPTRVAVQHRANISFGGQIRLFGYDLPEASPRPGHYLPVWLHWVAETAPPVDYEVQLRLLDSEGEPVVETASSPLNSLFPTSMWRSGDLVQGRHTLPLPPDVEGGWYRLGVRLLDPETQEAVLGRRSLGLSSREWIVVGRARILPWPRVTQPPTMEKEADGQFGEAVQLLGYDLAGRVRSGEELTVTLYWRVRKPLDKSYLVFMHLTDETGKLVSQADGIPANWLRPTTTWREGEIIIDEHTLTLPPELPAGDYRLSTGFYQPGGQRLPVVTGGESVPDGRLPLESLRVQESD